MGIFPRLKGGERRKFTLSNPPSWFTEWILGGTPTKSGVSVGPDAAMTLWAVYACVTLLAETVASLPLQVFRRRKGGGKDLAVSHWAYYLLHDKPNDAMTSFTWREMQQGHILLRGNQYNYLERTVAGRVGQVIPLPADKVQIVSDEKDFYFLYKGERVIRRENMLHVPGYTQDGVHGQSVISYQRESLGTALAMEQFGGQFFGTGTNPGAIITMPPEAEAMDEDALKKYIKVFTAQFAGLQNAQGLMVLPNGEKFERATVPLEDLQFLGLSKAKATDICGMFKVPPHMIGILDRATYSNIEHQAIQFVTNTLRPWLVRQEQAMNAYLLRDRDRREGYFVEYNIEGLLRGDAESRSKFYQTLFNLGAMSPNEIRALENLNPVEGGDEHFVMINLAPMSAVADISTVGGEGAARGAVIRRGRIELRGLPLEALARKQLADNSRPGIRRAAERLVAEEVRGLRDGLEEESRERAVQDFDAWLDAFYQGFRGTIRNYLAGVLTGLIFDIAGLTRDVLPMEPPEGIEDKFANDYLDGYVSRHIESSEGQLRALYATEEAPDEAISRRLDEWEERRPEKIAVNESARAASAIFAMMVFSIGSKVQWRIVGADTCPYCKAMNGKIIGRSEQFAGAGDTLKPDADTEPMQVYGTVRHPPLHYGCDCVIVAA